MEFEPPAELVVHGGLNHGLAVLPGWHFFDVSTLHSSAEDVPATGRRTDCCKVCRDVGGCADPWRWWTTALPTV